MTARIHVEHSLDPVHHSHWSEASTPSPGGSISLDYAPGDSDRALAVLEALVERVRADVEATEPKPAPTVEPRFIEPIRRPCGNLSDTPCHLDCATPAEWDAGSAAFRREASR